MKLIIGICVISTMLALVKSATVKTKNEPIPILRNSARINDDGSYYYAYETGNGISAEEEGTVHVIGKDQSTLSAQGEYRYTSPEGRKVHIGYLADQFGFQPFSDTNSIPVGPPTPVYILRALKFISDQDALKKAKKV